MTTELRVRLAFGALLAALVLFAAAPASAITCPGGSTPVDETLPSGARWEMCWEAMPAEGVVLRDVHYTAPGHSRRRVLKEASVGQIHVVYDDDRARRHIVSEDGLGGASLLDLTSERCPQGTLLSDGTANRLCQRIAGRGYIYKYYGNQARAIASSCSRSRARGTSPGSCAGASTTTEASSPGSRPRGA